MSRVAGKERGVRVYRSVDELPEVLEPGRYIVEEAVVELEEPAERGLVERLVRLAEELRSRGAEPL